MKLDDVVLYFILHHNKAPFDRVARKVVGRKPQGHEAVGGKRGSYAN